MKAWWIAMLLTLVGLAQNVIGLWIGSPNGESGFVDGPGAQARLFKPIRLARLDPSSIVFADINNHAVRRVDRQGQVTTLAGGIQKNGYQDGPADQARFSSPHGVAVRADGLIAVADAGNDAIRLMTPDGMGSYQVTTLAGSPGETRPTDGPNTQARFHAPHSLCWGNQGELYVADIGNGRLRKIQNGTTTTVAAQGLQQPMDLALDAQNRVWIADAGTMTLQRWESDSGLTSPFPNLKLQMPHGLSLDDRGNLYVAEMRANRVVTITPEGNITTLYDANLKKPAAVLWEPGGLWVADLGHHRILRLNLL